MHYLDLTRAGVALIALGLILTSADQAGAQQQEWTSYGSDLTSSKYVPLQQINAENVGELQIAWMWETPDNELFQSRSDVSAAEYKSTPLMVNGTLYVSTSLGQVGAVDALTGEELWTFDTGSWQRGRHPNFNNNHRGVAWWDDGVDGRVLMAANDGVLWSLNARTGQPDPNFANNGQLDLKQGLGSSATIGQYGAISPPLVINDVIVVGSSINDVPYFTDQVPPGHVRGFDAQTGEQRWIFHTVPQGDEPGTETWENDAWQSAGATNVWTLMSADPETGYVYLPVSTPNNDWYGGHRLGDNLYAESLVCLDAETGELIWHFQAVRHGLWDYDLPAAPNLVDISVDGEAIKAVAQVSKQGFVYVLDRMTGDPVWPIEERPVPQSTVPGERTSPTQPFPTRPAPFEPQGISDATLIDFTPELRAEALDLISEVDYGPLYTPPSERGVILFPGYSGGATWTGAAVDPEEGVMYVPSFSAPRFVRLRRPDPGESDFGFIRDRGFDIQGPQGLPLIKPPYARITAIDLNTGEHLWMVPHGEGIRQRLIDMGIDDPGPVGSFGRNGPLLTESLLFVAQLDGARPVFRSYNKQTGKVVSELDLPLPPMGTPMSYMVDSRQFIVMAVGAGPDTRLLALSLPAEAQGNEL
ncbi:pyrroloquinoline quinone-dependent dehydrogenase [Pseudohongiella sp. O18]|uniref:pyrroloquinoline quinone-dependent dehydrogenase n=1 Tax=Pseudohongiella sp. O18 TaxID=2904248 RepID=UPI001F3BC6DA|nr:pyrroloquinoline quinone-dependent dehydrogenase [Pseudohongiella sp. O18]